MSNLSYPRYSLRGGRPITESTQEALLGYLPFPVAVQLPQCAMVPVEDKRSGVKHWPNCRLYCRYTKRLEDAKIAVQADSPVKENLLIVRDFARHPVRCGNNL